MTTPSVLVPKGDKMAKDMTCDKCGVTFLCTDEFAENFFCMFCNCEVVPDFEETKH